MLSYCYCNICCRVVALCNVSAYSDSSSGQGGSGNGHVSQTALTAPPSHVIYVGGLTARLPVCWFFQSLRRLSNCVLHAGEEADPVLADIDDMESKPRLNIWERKVS